MQAELLDTREESAPVVCQRDPSNVRKPQQVVRSWGNGIRFPDGMGFQEFLYRQFCEEEA